MASAPNQTWFGRLGVKPKASSAVDVVLAKEADQVLIDELRETLHKLVEICQANGIDLPEEIQQRVKEEKSAGSLTSSHKAFLKLNKLHRSVENEPNLVDEYRQFMGTFQSKLPEHDVCVKNGSYSAFNVIDQSKLDDEEEGDGPRRAKQKIPTVATSNPCFHFYEFIRRCIVQRGNIRLERKEVKILENINLYLESGKMYLVLGAPGSGKSSLLKYISHTLFTDKNHVVGGELSVAGISPGKGLYWSKLVAYIDQIDRLHAYLTVGETCDFAWECRTGGTHARSYYDETEEARELIDKLDKERRHVSWVLEAFGLLRVRDTFVGDQQTVRGVSGGEKKRVTSAEMMCVGVPIQACDEISTGLDAATTFDITRLMGTITRIAKRCKIISLLQPPPETVANFDEIILLSDGRVIYSGPMEDIIDHFDDLGYEIPERMDLADWLQALPTKDGWVFLKGASEDGAKYDDFARKHLSPLEFHEKFYESDLGLSILEKVNTPTEQTPEHTIIRQIASQKFANPWYVSFMLLVRRETLLWWRDQYAIKAKIFQTLIMGTVAGTLFFQSTDNPRNVVSVVFQSMLYCLVSSMVLLVKQFPARAIFYKHQDAHFFPTWTYVVGRSLAGVPVALIDAVGYGSLMYWLVGLAYNDGASVANYFVFMLLLFVSSLTAGLVFSVFSAVFSVISTAVACTSITAVVVILFSGFTVQPNVIPVYYIWVYWLNCFSWLLRALVLNEFDSGKYDGPSAVPGRTQGEQILVNFGFTFKGEPFNFVWVWWGILYSIACCIVTVFLSTLCLSRIRFATGGSLVEDKGSDEVEDIPEEDMVEIPFTRVNLTFKDVNYVVTASTSQEELRLLNGIDGVIEAGKMTALMGSSGAGKTTLMDVLAMRKTSGTITGDIRLNGHPQKEKSFRRCAGYVEQFDTQSPQLTIYEIVKFSATLRLEHSDAAVTKESIEKFVYQTLNMLELTNIQDLQVGSDDTGGLSFEERKRLSIAVELVANPSIIFADEPTSGLDARAAAIVMRGFKRIAQSGRAVCCTIHQPSVSIFNDFDSLLLLKRGGEVVFHGSLGEESCNLIKYFELFESTPRIQAGENPATWMLKAIGAGSDTTYKPFDYAGSYATSELRKYCLDKIDKICEAKTDNGKVSFPSMYATSRMNQCIAVFGRTLKVYVRSPSYNTTRTIVSSVVALLFSSVYASQRVPRNESDMNSRINSIFMAVLFLCVNTQNSVMKVFETERNMFYRHKAANMYDSSAILLAYTFAEIPFVILASSAFVLIFYFTMGLAMNASQFFLFWWFVTLAIATYTYIGQMLVALLKDSQTAQGLGSLVISFTSLFSGVFIVPSEIPPYWIFLYWTLPGHWIFEGLFMSQFGTDQTMITASPGTAFYASLNCTDSNCQGTIEKWMAVTFASFSVDDIKWDIVYLICAIIVTRTVSFVGLTKLNYRAT